MSRPLTKKQQEFVDISVYFLSLGSYLALLRWVGAPWWAALGIAVAIAKIDAVGTSTARVRKRLGA